MKKEVRGVSAEVMTLLMNYRWPGNVRELEHAMQRAVILAQWADRHRPRAPSGGTLGNSRSARRTTAWTSEEHERKAIRRALERFGGNRRRAAKALNISTVTLWRRMKKYGLDAQP